MRFAADALSLLRVLLIIPILLLCAVGNWQFAFLLLLAAWATDPLDGLLARRYGSLRDQHPNFDADGIADSVLAFASSLVPVLYAWFYLSTGVALLLTELYVLTVVSGVLMTTVMNMESSRFIRMVIRINMVLFHGLIQIVAVIAWFGYMAYGWDAVVAVLVGSIVLSLAQRRKIRRWFAGTL